MLKASNQSPNYSILNPWWHYHKIFGVIGTLRRESLAHLTSFNEINDLRLSLFPLLPLLSIAFLPHSEFAHFKDFML